MLRLFLLNVLLEKVLLKLILYLLFRLSSMKFPQWRAISILKHGSCKQLIWIDTFNFFLYSVENDSLHADLKFDNSFLIANFFQLFLPFQLRFSFRVLLLHFSILLLFKTFMLEPSFSLLKCSHGFLRELILGDILAFELQDFFLELFFLLSD